MVWYVMVLYGVAWHGTVAWYATAWYGTARHGMGWDVIRYYTQTVFMCVRAHTPHSRTFFLRRTNRSGQMLMQLQVLQKPSLAFGKGNSQECGYVLTTAAQRQG